ncbi:MAG: hypothetical protein ABSC23_16605 [Bryobacteraceae bacterium]|jgi:hypothetical protein
MNEHYQAVLADLKQMKSEAEAGIRAIERLMARNPAGAGQIPRPRRESEDESDSTPAFVGSVPQRVLNFLNERQGQTFSIEEIGEGAEVTETQTLRGALGRLYAQKKIGKYGRGRYRARRPNELEQPSS